MPTQAGLPPGLRAAGTVSALSALVVHVLSAPPASLLHPRPSSFPPGHRTLEALQDRVPPRPFADIEHVLVQARRAGHAAVRMECCRALRPPAPSSGAQRWRALCAWQAPMLQLCRAAPSTPAAADMRAVSASATLASPCRSLGRRPRCCSQSLTRLPPLQPRWLRWGRRRSSCERAPLHAMTQRGL